MCSMSKTKPYGRVFINLNEQHKPLKKIAELNNIPMGSLARDLIEYGLLCIESGKLEIAPTTSHLKGSTK